MGSIAHLVVVGDGDGDDHLGWARERLAELEARWTRFSSDSELSRLNKAAGRPVMVSTDTYRLVETAVTAWERTGGRYDPTLLHELAGLGYDRTFTAIDQPPTRHLRRRGTSAGLIGLNPELQAVSLPVGTAIDPGGIGKGLAADLVTEELLGRGAAGVMVNLGGDLRVAGLSPTGTGGWPISVADPFDAGRELLRLEIPAGAVATTSRLERAWINRDRACLHHLLDPATGLPVDNDVAAVTVVAGEGWWAEALTKAVFTAGVSAGLDQLVNASAVIVDTAGRCHATPDLERTLR